MIVWTDVESTGLDECEGYLLEVALVVTDDELRERAATSVVIDPDCSIDDLGMPLVVREMHEKSGLLADIAAGKSVLLDQAQMKLISWLLDTFGRIEDLRGVPLAGSTVGFDRRWLRHNMASLEALFSHRSIDVSSLVELAQRWAPAVHGNRPKQDKSVAHRALDDVRTSVEYLRYFRAAGFVGGAR